MPAFQKVCPKCASILHVRKSRCPCGHCFSTKPKLVLKSENVMKSLESRKNSMAECQARKRDLESSDQSHRRRLTDSKCHGLKRARETSAEFQSRKQADSEYRAHKKARATPEESQICKQTNAKCNTQKRAQETSEETRRRKQADVKCHAQKKAQETPEETQRRKQANVHCHAQKKAQETPEETQRRKQANVHCHAQKRAQETPVETQRRKQANVHCHAQKRAQETPEETQRRRQANSECQVRIRSQGIPLPNVIQSFIAKTKQGPDYVCKSCHRLMYKKSVISLNVHKYVKASPELLSDVFSPEFIYSNDGKEWICNTCHTALTRGKMPTQAIANGLKLPTIPPELSCLNLLEVRLISLRLPFMKMVALPSGKQRCIHGPAVNVPSKLDNVCTVLPRLPSQSELVALKLKRKLSYKGHYMYDYVTP